MTPAASLFAWPLVSIVVTSYNYAAFLPASVRSAREQTYPHVELIIVDDCSTDGTAAVLDQIEKDWPDIAVVRLPTNSGQSAACTEGLRHAHGDYVLFLDSDDILLPECVATHLSVHISSRRAIGFTCSDSLQVVSGRLVTARNCSISDGFLRLPYDPQLISAYGRERLAQEGVALPPVVSADLRYVWPNCAEWFWSTTSCMMFRRTVLDLVLGAGNIRELRIATDGYLTFIANMLSGSILIDRPLVMYRIHGANKSQATANLDGFANSKMDPKLFEQVVSIFSRDFAERFALFSETLDGRQKLIDVCGQIGHFCKFIDPASETTTLSRALVERRATLDMIVGAEFAERLIDEARRGQLPQIPGAPGPRDDRTRVELEWRSIRDLAREFWAERARSGLFARWFGRKDQHGPS